MRKGWKLKTLKDVGKIFSGNSINAKIKKEKYLNQPEGLPYIATKDVSYDSSINYDNGVKIPFSKKELFRIAPKNSVLICAEGGSAGRKIGRINQDVCFVNKLFAITPDNETVSKYLFYWYKSDKFKFEFNSRLTGLIGGVSKKKFETIPIPFPENIEQEYIVEKLDTCMEQIHKAIQNVEQNIQNAEELFRSQLNQVFNESNKYKKMNWSEVLEIRSGRSQKSVLNPNGIYPIVGSAGKVMGYADDYICDEQTTIIGRKGTIDKPKFLRSKFWNVDTAFGLIAGDLLENKYLYYFCLSFDFKIMDRGTTLPSLVKKDLLKILMPIPGVDLQKIIIKKLDSTSLQIKKVISNYKEELESLNELKQSILEKAFNGEL
ncbi:restriction endonuclease subunit S [Candidatus Marinimicrobia bacterium]|nr:restriction endonuclease subunit S [Candidatus Neomarinimicrobiota bacterium]